MNTNIPDSSSPSFIVPQSHPSHRFLGVLMLVLGIVGGLAAAVAKSWLWSQGNWTAEASGYCVGALLFPGILAYLIGGRKKVRSPIRFGLSFLGISVLLLVMELSHAPLPKNTVADALKEAAGTRPSSEQSNDPMDVLVRQVMRDFVDRAKVYQQQTAAFETDLGQLYSAQSYAEPAANKRMQSALGGLVALDHNFQLQIQAWPERVHQQVAQSALSESQKSGFITGFDRAFADSKQLQLRKQADEVEAEWAKETIALYSFALANSTRINSRGSEIIINDEAVRSRFNDQLKKSQVLRGRFVDMSNQLQQMQRESLEKFGLTQADIGLGADGKNKQ